MKNNNILTTLLLIIILGLVVWYLFLRKDPVLTPKISYHYITDTVYIDKVYEIERPQGTTTKPVVIVKYEVDSSSIDSLNLLIDKQSLIITGLKDSISVNVNYLTQFPNNPKLISLNVDRDTLMIGLLPTSGRVEERIWPIDLNHWSYTWEPPTIINRHPPTNPTPSEKPFVNYLVGGGVDILRYSPYISGSVEKDFSRIRLHGDIQIGLLNKETHSIRIGLQYRLNAEKGNN